ncbi:MAG: hypothetical protein ACKOA8_13800 [Deltaproteobacteria bacterium]
MKRLTLLICLSFVVPTFAMREFYGISRSIRALGMGGAFYGRSDDEYALFYNPAGVSLYQGKTQSMVNFGSQVGNRTFAAFETKKTLSSKSLADSIDALAQYQGDPLYLGGSVLPYFLMKHLAVGVLLGDVKADYLLSGKELDSSVDFTGIIDSGLLVSYGRTVGNEYTHIGLTAKGILRSGGRVNLTLADLVQGDKVNLNPKDLGGTGFGIDFDLGVMYDIPYLDFGQANRISFVVSNLLASSFSMGSKSTGQPPGLTRTFSIGWHSVFSGGDLVDHYHVMADLAEFQLGGESNPHLGARSGKILKHLNLGVEVPVGALTVRTGIHQGYVSVGLGFNLTYAKLDFATYQEELSSGPGRLPSRRYALTLALGLGAPNGSFKSKIKGKKIEGGSPEVEIKLVPKAPIDPKIDPSLELTPPDPHTEIPKESDISEPVKKQLPESDRNQMNSNEPSSKEGGASEPKAPAFSEDESLYQLETPKQ